MLFPNCSEAHVKQTFFEVSHWRKVVSQERTRFINRFVYEAIGHRLFILSRQDKSVKLFDNGLEKLIVLKHYLLSLVVAPFIIELLESIQFDMSNVSDTLKMTFKDVDVSVVQLEHALVALQFLAFPNAEATVLRFLF